MDVYHDDDGADDAGNGDIDEDGTHADGVGEYATDEGTDDGTSRDGALEYGYGIAGVLFWCC